MSVLQDGGTWVSQATSTITPVSASPKNLMVRSRILWTRDFQISAPLVWLVRYDLCRQKATYIVVHVGCTQQPHACVVAVLDVVDCCAVKQIVRAIVNVVFGIDESDCLCPVPCLLSQLGICLIVRISCEPSPEVEEAAVRDGVLIVVSIVERENLPF